MAQGRVDLQPAFTIASGAGSVEQEVRFAGKIPGGAKSGLMAIQITNPGAGGAMNIVTAPELNIDISQWKGVAGAGQSTAAAGLFLVNLTAMCDYIRWSLTGLTGGPLRFSIVVHVFEA